MRKRRFTNKNQSSYQNNISSNRVKTLDEIVALEKSVQIEKQLILQKSFESSNILDIVKAQDYLQQQNQNKQDEIKSIVVDPNNLGAAFGYKDKPFSLSYDMLRAMAKTHIIKAIIQTRKAQVIQYCEPQTDRFNAGFIIDKKQKWRSGGKEELTKQEQQKAEAITEFICNCGLNNDWRSESFERFTSKIMEDSLVIDQVTAEVQRDRLGRPISFFATDGATYRIADSYFKEIDGVEKINGYQPAFVQVIEGKVYNSFYFWDLIFGIRNPSTDIRLNGYGKSELEDMIQIITSILNADAYNANFFKVGSSPKGILSYSGNINQASINDFRNQWQAQVASVSNAHKIPLINADKINFIPTHVPNKDMEFNMYQEFLIKVACAAYTIDPSEIGFPMAGASGSSDGLGGRNNSEKLKYSKDKGLKPLLKNYQYWLNRNVVSQIDPNFELRFVGIDDFEDKGTDLENDIKKLGAFMTVNEIRIKHNLKPIDGMDIILNPVASQASMMAMQGNPESNDAVDQMQQGENEDEENPFLKSLSSDIEKIFNSEKPDND